MAPRHPATRTSRLLHEAWVAGSLASALSALALTWAGHREIRSSTAPLNAVSHWRWGNPALRKRGFTGRHTLLGYAIHHCASIWWAGIHAIARHRHPRADQTSTVLLGALTTSAVACVVDFKCTPQRLTPGFEHHLSRKALAGVYLHFAAGLALGALSSRATTSRNSRK
ncbi:MAG: hypothetical protein Q4B46_06595 [Comamonadaceae bacterium]|nr:hypothetical protein [Comamonadaceae bacterium]